MGPQGCRQLLVTKRRERKNGKRIQHAKEGEADKGELVEEASTLPAPPAPPYAGPSREHRGRGPRSPGKVVTLSRSPRPNCGFLWQESG